MAQPSPERFFGYLDRNQDGRIDGDEIQRMPGPIRDGMKNAGIDLSRGISQDEFTRQMPRMMEEMRRRREEGGGFGGRPPGGEGGGDGRGPSDNRRPDDRRRDSGSRGQPPAKPTRWKPKPRERVTFDLDETWRASDFNGDGQIGLYEWDRAKLSEFLRLDTNHDGLLTPREISFATDASPAPTSAAVATPVRGPTGIASRPIQAKTTSSSASAVGPAAGAKISPVEFDRESAEGRWAKFVFKTLDKNKDGSLAQDEWNASKSTRMNFKKYRAQVTFPTDFEKFAPWLVAVQRAEKKR
jgi:hypothetical protein